MKINNYDFSPPFRKSGVKNKGRYSFASSLKRIQQRGFALISTIVIMALVLVLVLAIANLSSVEVKTVEKKKYLELARDNARMALMIALGDLQAAVGPDRRVTARADIFDGSDATTANWTGVWDTTNHDPQDPETRQFVRWLVPTQNSSNLDYYDSLSGSTVTIFDGGSSGVSVDVPLVKINLNTDNPGAYSYWVEDEGTKADLAWFEGLSSSAGATTQQIQTARLASTSGIDYGVFKNSGGAEGAEDVDPDSGPFDEITFNYPLSFANNTSFLSKIDKAINSQDMLLMDNSDVKLQSWLQENRHHITLGSSGVLSDTKWSGLKRDLSLATEMDESTDRSVHIADWNEDERKFDINLGLKFLAQTNEFSGVANSSVLNSRQPSDGILPRYLYAHDGRADWPFSDDLDELDEQVNGLIRGANWNAVRDYALSYKRISGTPGNYVIDARPNHPNRFSTSTGTVANVLPLVGNIGETVMYNETIQVGRRNTFYFDMPNQVNYAPVHLGTTISLSAFGEPVEDGDTDGRRLSLGIDPIFYLWNPYNRRITAPQLVVSYRTALPGFITIWKHAANGDVISKDTASIKDYVNQSAGRNQNGVTSHMTYRISDVVLEPGEIRVYSPPADESLVSDNSNHPYNTDALPGVDISTISNAQITRFRDGNGWSEIQLSDYESITLAWGLAEADHPDVGGSGQFVKLTMPDPGFTNRQIGNLDPNALPNAIGGNNQVVLGTMFYSASPQYFYHGLEVDPEDPEKQMTADYFFPQKAIHDFEVEDGVTMQTSDLAESKYFFGTFAHLKAPANYEGGNPTPIEFLRFNPLAQGFYGNDNRMGSWHEEIEVICNDFGPDFSASLEAVGVSLVALRPDELEEPEERLIPIHGYWGASYSGSGSLDSTAVPLIDIPVTPLYSLGQLAHANLTVVPEAPIHAVGTSLVTPFIDPAQVFGQRPTLATSGRPVYMSDHAWSLNDALFDRYFFSGLAPEFTVTNGYEQTNSLREVIEKFYGDDFRQAFVNPVLRPYFPGRNTADDIVNELTGSDNKGYLKLGAYAFVNGQFNVNSTSVPAWEALLRVNRELDIKSAERSAANSPDILTPNGSTPFPRGTSPSNTSKASSGFAGVPTLTDNQISRLATEIVEQVRIRGPFMSLSDFVNRRVGNVSSATRDTRLKGALQAAIDESGINTGVAAAAGGITFNYQDSQLSDEFVNPTDENRNTAYGIVGEVTQLDILTPIAPRLNARSDTFRIRAYGEALDTDGVTVLATATCEAVVQRVPEYVDQTDKPWIERNFNPFVTGGDEPGDPRTELDSPNISDINDRFGRKVRIVRFRWLNVDEA